MSSEPSPERKPNRLIGETSPYLRQHAYNPVDWHPWGDEALGKARELDRPIFLSIGYSSCHWCHVMERESFENEEIARILNERFVSIKVDREERPDLDALYMNAVQMLTGSGGWPMSVFLTPELKPFWGGTYFPPDSRHGRPGFGQILVQLSEVYRADRAKVEEAARSITSHLVEEAASAPAGGGVPGHEVLTKAVEYARQTFDTVNGGFGRAPKFPRSIELMKLLRHWERTKEVDVLAMCETTLERMAAGGMYDQVAGGFHRYSTDDRWLVPHFEKMLYDNALLARAYLEAFQATGKDLYERIARETLDYVLLEMTSPDGGFYSATDADSEGEEGKFFVWTPEEVEAIAGKTDARAFCERHGITAGGNFEGGSSIPHVARTIEEVAKALKLEAGSVREALSRARKALYEARQLRPKPFRDDKVLASWNGLMVSALARASQALDEPRYLDAAERAANLITSRMMPGGRLHRSYMDGRCRFPGYLDDHAYLAEAFLDLYESSFRLEHLGRAKELVDVLLERFWDTAGGGFYFTADFHEALLARRKDPIDNATPSGNGVACLCMLRLERLTGEARYRERAVELLKGVSALLERVPMAMSSTVLALDFLLRPPVEVAISGDPASGSSRDLLRAVHEGFLPRKVLCAASPSDSRAAESVPLLRGKDLVAGQPAAYVCRDFACQAPVTEPAALREALRGSGGRA